MPCASVRIAESGTFSKAADSMNIPRPTVTKLVQDLERHLATKLLHRTTRRVSVTPEGAAYYERATRLIADLDWVTCASPLYLGARGVPKHPSELAREPESKQDTGVPGHAIAGYFSSLTGRAFPLEFRKGDEQILVQGQVVVAVNESTAHLSALLAGVGLGQAFKFMVVAAPPERQAAHRARRLAPPAATASRALSEQPASERQDAAVRRLGGGSVCALRRPPRLNFGFATPGRLASGPARVFPAADRLQFEKVLC